MTGLTGVYVRFLRRVLRHPSWNVVAVTALLAVIFMSFNKFGRGVEMFPNVEPEFASVDIRARGDLSTDEKDVLVRQG